MLSYTGRQLTGFAYEIKLEAQRAKSESRTGGGSLAASAPQEEEG